MGRPAGSPTVPSSAIFGADRQSFRFEKDAERILEDILHRHRWCAKDRDELASAIRRIVHREMREAAK